MIKCCKQIIELRGVLCAVPNPSSRCTAVKSYDLSIYPFAFFAGQEADSPRNVNGKPVSDQWRRMCRHLSLISWYSLWGCFPLSTHILPFFGGIFLTVRDVVL